MYHSSSTPAARSTPGLPLGTLFFIVTIRKHDATKLSRFWYDTNYAITFTEDNLRVSYSSLCCNKRRFCKRFYFYMVWQWQSLYAGFSMALEQAVYGCSVWSRRPNISEKENTNCLSCSLWPLYDPNHAKTDLICSPWPFYDLLYCPNHA